MGRRASKIKNDFGRTDLETAKMEQNLGRLLGQPAPRVTEEPGGGVGGRTRS